MKLSTIAHFNKFEYMKTLFALCALLFALSSCLTVNRIQRNCNKFAQLCTNGSNTITIYRDTTIYRHDTVFFQLPPDTVKIQEKIYIENNQAILKPIKKQIGFIGVNAWIKNNSLNINAWLTDSTILIPYRDTILIPGAISTTTATNTVTVHEKYIPKFYKLCFWFVIIQFTAAVFFVAGYFLKFKFKLLNISK